MNAGRGWREKDAQNQLLDRVRAAMVFVAGSGRVVRKPCQTIAPSVTEAGPIAAQRSVLLSFALVLPEGTRVLRNFVDPRFSLPTLPESGIFPPMRAGGVVWES